MRRGGHRGRTGDRTMMSLPIYVLKDSFVWYQDLSKYVVFKIIKQRFLGEPALKNHF